MKKTATLNTVEHKIYTLSEADKKLFNYYFFQNFARSTF